MKKAGHGLFLKILFLLIVLKLRKINENSLFSITNYYLYYSQGILFVGCASIFSVGNCLPPDYKKPFGDKQLRFDTSV